MAVVINPSVNINIVYSTEHDYNYLINEGIASQGDLIIESVSNDGNGVIHIQDTDFYLSGFAIYKNGQLIGRTQASYIKANSENEGDIKFTGVISGNEVSANIVSFSNLAYNKTGKDLVKVIEGLDNIPWRLQFDRNVIPQVDDIIIDGKYFSKNYITQADTSLLFQTKDAANVQLLSIKNLVKDTSTEIYAIMDSSVKGLDVSIRNTDASIIKLRQDLKNTSTYYYSEPSNTISSANDIHSVKSAIDVLLSDKFYNYPEDVSVICTINPSTFIKGKRLADGIKCSWRMVNYITEADHRAYTQQNYEGTITTNLYNYTATISSTEIMNATSDIRKYLIISNSWVDSHGNSPKTFVYDFIAKMIVEEYYYCSENETIGNIASFTANIEPIQFLDDEEGYKKLVVQVGSTPQYIFLVLENTNMPAFYIYESDDNGVLGERSLEGGIDMIQSVSITKYNKALTYTIFRTSQKQVGNICIQYK